MSAVPSSEPSTCGLLYERHGAWLHRFCLSRLRDREEAEDAVQTTFLYALRCLGRGVVPESEEAWLCAIVNSHDDSKSGTTPRWRPRKTYRNVVCTASSASARFPRR